MASLMSSISSSTSPRGTTQPAVIGTPRASSTIAPNSSSASNTRYTAHPPGVVVVTSVPGVTPVTVVARPVCRAFARRGNREAPAHRHRPASYEGNPFTRPFTPTPRATPPREVIQSIFAAVPVSATSGYFAASIGVLTSLDLFAAAAERMARIYTPIGYCGRAGLAPGSMGDNRRSTNRSGGPVTGKVLPAVGHALALAGSMTWEILWALILGFALSAVVQAVVRRSTIVSLMGDDRPRTLAVAAGLGAASSSCSYAAVALARSLFRKGANFTAAMAFEIGSTNLVVELGIILALLMGWQFTAAEFIGGPLMIVVLAVLFRLFVRSRLIDNAREQADAGSPARWKAMPRWTCPSKAMARSGGGCSPREGFTSVSHVFVMEWMAILRDLVFGPVDRRRDRARGCPNRFWQSFFLADHPGWAALWGPIVGPVVAIVSFVCSIGNVPLAAVLWNGGISFGGVDRVHLRRPDDPADPEHLPEVLRHQDGAGHCWAPSTSRWSPPDTSSN